MSDLSQIRAVRTELAVQFGGRFGQTRAVYTHFVVGREQIVANQGGMDGFGGAIWRPFWANQGGRGVYTDFVVGSEKIATNQGGMDRFGGAVLGKSGRHTPF